MSELNCDNTDVYVYIGDITRTGYDNLSAQIENRVKEDKISENVIFCISTYGGDPNAGYRMGRALQHYYAGNVSVLVPSLCKSAGTLAVISANNLIIGDRGELGPLDIQLRKADEMGESSSSLDIFKAVDQLESRTLSAFRQYLTDIKYGSGISTRLSADIASQLVSNLFQPVASQIDPHKIGEHQRAMGIALSYGERLTKKSKNLKSDALNKLIVGYPSHGFVIDRSEAKELFSKVNCPSGLSATVYEIVSGWVTQNPSIIGNPPLVIDFEEILKDKISEESNKEIKENDNRDNGTEPELVEGEPVGAESSEASEQPEQGDESGTKKSRTTGSKRKAS
ncbi:SppA protein [Morganella morganii]|nr:SppA protein [Morganella morganii]HEI8570204.1 SppA protein [Morganella morganii]